MLFEALFEIDGLCKRFGRIAALSHVSFQVRAGKVLGLIGPNGAGKSTLFECLGGVLPGDSGAMRSGGRPVGTRERPSPLFYVPDGIAPWPAQSVRWALDFTLGFFGGRPALRDEVIDQTRSPPVAASEHSVEPYQPVLELRHHGWSSAMTIRKTTSDSGNSTGAFGGMSGSAIELSSSCSTGMPGMS
jgi:energy-coupling factor transporter ATP-binding protein EcfA2